MVHSIWTLLAQDIIFQKLAQKLGKEVSKPNTTDDDMRDPAVSRPHWLVTQSRGMWFDQLKLTNGDSSSETEGTGVLLVTSRT